MADNLALSLASRRVRIFVDDEQRHHDAVKQSHEDAMNCRDCEDFLQLGINAFKWLKTAEETMREADYEGLYVFDRQTQEALDVLYAAWLDPCEYATKWIKDLEGKGYTPDNFEKFNRASIEVSEIVDHRDWKNRARKSRILAEVEESW